MKRLKMKRLKMNVMMVVNLVMVVIILILSIKVVDTYEMPEFNDGLTGRWHPGALCITCHYSLTDKEKAQNISNGCKCHSTEYIPKGAISSYNVNKTKIFDLHEKIVCVRCHIGVKDREITVKDLHEIKNKIACTKCHIIDNATIKIPEKKLCYECHGGDPHVVHGNKTEKLCIACHGEFGERYINRTLKGAEMELVPEYLKKNETKVVEGVPTIFDFLAKIIKSIIG
jgi:hypothetical protein